jgi:hypothetical protein
VIQSFIKSALISFLVELVRKLVADWMDKRAKAELKERADAQIVREHTPLGDDDLDKRLRDGSA